MNLEVFEGAARTRVNLIRTYNYVTYTEELGGEGSFEIRIPTSETSLENLEIGNFILFEDDVVGIIKGIKDVEDSDTEITVYGYMANHILTYRSFLKTEKIYGNAATMITTFFNKLFGSNAEAMRKISFLELQEDLPAIIENSITWQATGKRFFDYVVNALSRYGCGLRVTPVISNYREGEHNPNIEKLIVNVIQPTNRMVDNGQVVPVVFSFDMNNVESYEFEQNSQSFCTVAVVASEGEGQERKVIEIQSPSNLGPSDPSGYDRIELYVDARDIQSENTETDEPLTDEELEELMVQRGLEALEENDRFESFDAKILQGNYKYKEDYFLGDYVTVMSKDGKKQFGLQINKITKSISNGIEHLDIGFGEDWFEVKEKRQTAAINKVANGSQGGGSSNASESFRALNDVSFYGLTNGQIPKYNSVTNKWENADETSNVSVTPKVSTGVNVADIEVAGSTSRIYAPEVLVTQKLQQGVNIADVSVGGNNVHLYAPSGSGGSQVSITPTLALGTKIADYSIDGVAGALFTPDSSSGLPFEVTVLSNGKVRLTYDE